MKTNPAGILRFGLLVLLALFSCGPVQAQQTFNFDDEQSSLSQFIFTLNGDGDTDNSVWKIEQVSDAPSPKQALAILKADALESSFPMALLKGVKIQDFDASVKFKIAGGTVGQSAGLVVRAVDADHCYVLKASVHDNSLTLLKVNKQTRTKLGSGRIGIHLNHWHTLRITARGTKFEAQFDGAKILTAGDSTYLTGKVGLVSQGDSIVYFDDLMTGPAPEL